MFGKIKLLRRYLESVIESRDWYKSRANYWEDETCKLSDEYRKLEEEYRKLEEENKEIKKELDNMPVKLSSLNINVIKRNMEDEAWNGRESTQTYIDFFGNPVIEFCGRICEPQHNLFNTDCLVCGYDDKKNKLYLQYPDDLIENYVKEHDCYVVLQKQ